MPKLTVADLDALAAEHSVADYPADGLKDEKIAALEAAGVDLSASEPPTVYRLRLRDDANAAQFNSGGEEIRLDRDSPTFETTDAAAYLGARALPFLEEVAD